MGCGLTDGVGVGNLGLWGLGWVWYSGSMSNKKGKNTLDKGVVRCLVYQLADDGEDVYYATALEFNLTVSAEDGDSAFSVLREQMEAYVETAQEKDAPELLNQEVDPNLERMWVEMVTNEQKEGDKVATSHCRPIHAAISSIPAMMPV